MQTSFFKPNVLSDFPVQPDELGLGECLDLRDGQRAAERRALFYTNHCSPGRYAEADGPSRNVDEGGGDTNGGGGEGEELL